MVISLSAVRAPAWTLLGSALRIFLTLWTLCRSLHKVHYAKRRIMWTSDQLAAMEGDFEHRRSA